MPEPEKPTEDLASTGFDPSWRANIARPLVGTPAEIAAFKAARDAVQAAQYRIDVLAADIERHRQCLLDGIRIRTAEKQAELSLEELERIMVELQKVGRSLRIAQGADTEVAG